MAPGDWQLVMIMMVILMMVMIMMVMVMIMVMIMMDQSFIRDTWGAAADQWTEQILGNFSSWRPRGSVY